MEPDSTTFLNNTRVLDRVLRRTQEKKLDSCDIKNMLTESFNYVTVPKTYSKKSWHGFGKPTYYSKNEFITYKMLEIDTERDDESMIAWIKKYRNNAVIMYIGDLKLVIIDRRTIAEENRQELAKKEKKRKEEYEAYTSPAPEGTTKEELELRRLLQTPWYHFSYGEERFTQNSLSDYAVISGIGNVHGCRNYEVLENHLIEVVSDYMVGFKVNTISNCRFKDIAERYLIHFK